MSFPNVHILEHPVIQTKLTELRDYTADHRKFRALLDEIAGLMVYEVTRDWPTRPQMVRTPLEATTGQVLARRVTLGLGVAAGAAGWVAVPVFWLLVGRAYGSRESLSR